MLCVDAKSQIRALGRSQPMLPMLMGDTFERRPHDYKRNGITTRFVAFDTLTREVIGEIHRRHRAKEFLGGTISSPAVDDRYIRWPGSNSRGTHAQPREADPDIRR